MRNFANTGSKYKQYLITATISHINSARLKSANNKIKELKRKSRGFGSFTETRKRLLLAFGVPDTIESTTAYTKRRESQTASFASKKKKKR